MEYILLITLIATLIFIYSKKTDKTSLILNENLRKEIQEIRKEIFDNSEPLLIQIDPHRFSPIEA